ncbi:hypothetical protein [Burkholderia cepacia]|uniref:hypothetical protein n=1 Tax=Burkholderia cepacia TaxID=292 RepID=UPI002AB65747|nr:hypothetical protein [Burkholderia cepacia]
MNQPAKAKRPVRILAVLQPQTCLNDLAVDIGDSTEIDVTDKVLALPLEDILHLENDDYDSDELVCGQLGEHAGPFRVEVVEQVRAYFGVRDLMEITPSLLDAVRRLRASQSGRVEYVIRSLSEGQEDLDGPGVFWSNEVGWGDLKTATRFTTAERMTLRLPISTAGDAEWMLSTEALLICQSLFTFDVEVIASEGNEDAGLSLGTVRVRGVDESEAVRKASDKLWEPRLDTTCFMKTRVSKVAGTRRFDRAAARRAGFKVHLGTHADDPALLGRWWWTLSQPGWIECESSQGDFATAGGAWADAICRLHEEPELVCMDHAAAARGAGLASTVHDPRLTVQQAVALITLEAALIDATDSGLLDELLGHCKSPDSINDLCDVVSGRLTCLGPSRTA